MKIDLSGKSAIVTGSTAGIGFAAAAKLAVAGARVIINGRQERGVAEAVARLKGEVPGAAIEGVAGDVSTPEGCDVLIQAVPQADILVNNAGIFGPQSFFDISDAEWDRFFQTNVMSGVRLSRHYLRGMLERNWGRVVFLSSESAVNIPVDMIHYGFTKTALLGISRGLAKLAAGSSVTVNAVLPGPTLTEGVAAMLKPDVDRSGRPIEEVGADFVRSQRATSIIRRLATPEEVANMIVFACSREASATTGAALRVEGGVVESIL
jgi:NAD(P)-dependent dehydrogenase (short-subunit alcohol dehydrogenase family)